MLNKKHYNIKPNLCREDLSVYHAAVIIGGGIAGLLAARVLCEHFKEVTIIEKDKYPFRAGPRNGTPQSNHIHLLLIKGKEILLTLFPNLESKLMSKGAHILNLTKDVNYYVGTGYSLRFESDLTTIACSRQLLEHEIRNEILEIPKVKFHENARVTGLVVEKYNETGLDTCKGVTVLSVDTHSNETILGNLVVDASGRESKTAEWLEQLGYGRPEKTVVNSYIGYSTCRFKPASEHTFDTFSSSPSASSAAIKPTIIMTKPPLNPRMGVIYPVEDSSWLVGILGIGKKYPPTDKEEFLQFTKELETPDIYNAIKDCKLDGRIYGYRTSGSRQYHYEKMKVWPENFVAYGDSVSSFNPFYGQGITVACIESVTLDKTLRKHKKRNRDLQGFSTSFQKKVAKINTLPWLLGTSEDFRWPTTEGTKPDLITRCLQKYSYRVLLLTPKSKITTKSFFEVMHMIRSPLILFHPLISFQVLFETLKSNFFKQRNN
jgi:2-polyprenyl-6-methoxyphenol hydroxylase-like FAD-dependent oxidoreductase